MQDMIVMNAYNKKSMIDTGEVHKIFLSDGDVTRNKKL